MAKPKDRIITTEEDFELFKTYCKRYAEWLGLGEWKLYYEHGNIHASPLADGQMQRYLTQRKASIRLAKTISYNETIQYVAQHEICEVILASLDWAAGMAICRDIVEEYRHEAINHIVKLLEMLDEQHNAEERK
jgi:hypothetical protein